jgi:hypothetical protein
MNCKFCGMEITAEPCSHCGQPQSAAMEAPSPTISELDPSVAIAPPPADAASVGDFTTEAQAPVGPAAPKSTLQKSGGPRKPAPAMMAPASDRVRSGPKQADASPQVSAQAAAVQLHVSLSDPLAEHALYMQNAELGRSVQMPSADAEVLFPAFDAPSPDTSPAPAAMSAATVVTPATTIQSPRATPETPTDTADANEEPQDSDKAREKEKKLAALRGPIVPFALLGRYSGAFALVLLMAGGLAYIGPNYSAVPLLVAQFVGALLLAVMRLVPWQDEDSGDVIIFVLLTLMFGPVVSLVVYGILGVVRQVNPAIVGCMTVAALTRLVVDFAAHAASPVQILAHTMPFLHPAQMDFKLVKTLLKDWSGMIALAGWYFANIFHKFDE